jgi:hypothetical protein
MKTFTVPVSAASVVRCCFVAVVLILLMAPARAPVLERDVSGVFASGNSAATRDISGCTVGGDIVIDAAADVVTSADVTVSGFAPAMGPFTIFAAVGFVGQTVIELSDVAGDTLDFVFDAPVQEELAGYTGGALNTGSEIFGSTSFSPDPIWFLTLGSLTPVSTAVPEPNSLILLMTVVH